MKAWKILSLAATLCITIIYLALNVPVKSSNAAVFNPVYGNTFNITAHEQPQFSCPDGQLNNLSSYAGYYAMTNVTNQPQTVTVVVHNYHCDGIVSDCEKNDNATAPQTITIGAHQNSPIFYSKTVAANFACGTPGTYQTDLELKGFNSYTFQSATWCHVQTPCATPTPTPHYGCQNYACVLNGTGKTCGGTSDTTTCAAPHYGCQNYACVLNGTGATCNGTSDTTTCAAPHYGCQNYACVLNGTGKTCGGTNDTTTCAAPHYGCENNACVLNGKGATCDGPDDSYSCVVTTPTPTPTVTPTPTICANTTTDYCDTDRHEHEKTVDCNGNQIGDIKDFGFKAICGATCTDLGNCSNNNNSCNNNQSNNGGSANNNCNNNNNNQNQTQTQNNNQSVNVTVSNPAPVPVVQQVLGSYTSLPSTGTPISDLLFLGSMLPAGIFIRRKS